MMIAQRVRGIHTLLTATQGLLAAMLFWAWFGTFVWLYPEDPGAFVIQYVAYCALLIIGLMLEPMSRSMEQIASPLYQDNFVKQLPITLRQTGFAVGFLLLFLVLAKDRALSRAFLISFSPVLYFLLLVTNYLLPKQLARYLFKGNRIERTLLVGPASRADILSRWLSRKEQFGVHSVGILSDEPLSIAGMPHLGPIVQIQKVLEEKLVTQVILLELPHAPAIRNQIIEATLRQGARLLILSDMEEKLRHPIVNFDDDGLNFVALHQEPLENPFNRVWKRMMDITVALFVVLFLLPPLACLVWIVQRFQSPGPLFFIQTRAGIQNKSFNIFKFRSMDLPGSKPVAEENHDPNRIYPAARFLRRYSLDEFPQFINVLKGEMSVVGPRPHLLVHNQQFAQVMKNYHVRSLVKPGITGLAQVRGFRGEAKETKDIEARLQSDISYIENWSFALDVTIFFRTMLQMVLPPDGAN